MLEVEADLWEVEADARVISVNKYVNASGNLVMGRGCAMEASKRYPDLAQKLGARYKVEGDTTTGVFHLKDNGLIAFPVKPAIHIIPGSTDHHQGWMCGYRVGSQWCKVEVLRHILQGLSDLVSVTNGMSKIVLPRLGCGFGSLNWGLVRPILASVLDDRFVAAHLPSKLPPR